jgi:hypothetical protein
VLRLEGTVLANDPRVVRSSRAYHLDGETLRYEVSMETTAVTNVLFHAQATLRRA